MEIIILINICIFLVSFTAGKVYQKKKILETLRIAWESECPATIEQTVNDLLVK